MTILCHLHPILILYEVIIMNKDDVYIVEEFVVESKNKLIALKDSLDIMELSSEQRQLFTATLMLMDSKIQAIIEADSKKEIKKVLKLKDLLRDKR